MKTKKIKKPLIIGSFLLIAFAILCLIGRSYALRYLENEKLLAKPEIQWAIEHPEHVLKAKQSYEAVQKAADEVFFGILEQGK